MNDLEVCFNLSIIEEAARGARLGYQEATFIANQPDGIQAPGEPARPPNKVVSQMIAQQAHQHRARLVAICCGMFGLMPKPTVETDPLQKRNGAGLKLSE